MMGAAVQPCSLPSGQQAPCFVKPNAVRSRITHKRHSSTRLVITAGFLDGLFGGSKGAVKSCKKCSGKGAVACPGCKGTGRNKKNGNVFERWKCYDCQGFGQITCPQCSGGLGLTPEQRRER